MHRLNDRTLKDKLRRTSSKLRQFLKKYDIKVPNCRIEIDKNLDKSTLATHFYPNKIIVKDLSVPESVICHELIHRVQNTLESPKMFRYIYTILSEGMAEFISKTLYPNHKVKYRLEKQLFETLFSIDRNVIKEVIELNNFKINSKEFELISKNKNLHKNFREMIHGREIIIKKQIKDANCLGINDTTFISHGEEIMAWKFLLAPKFEIRRREINKILRKLF